MTESSGINLSAFSVDLRPLLAVAQAPDKRGNVLVELRPLPAFSGRIRQADPLEDLFARWRAALLELPRPIGLDLALDAQGLGGLLAQAPRYTWQVTHRPLDFAFFLESPLVDKIGTTGMRFRQMLACSSFELGTDLIETQPHVTVEMLEFKGTYRGAAIHHGSGGWKPDDRNKRSDKMMAKLVSDLGINPGSEATTRLTAADLDAALCALAALGATVGAGLIPADRLEPAIERRLERRMNLEPGSLGFEPRAPQGAAILADPFWETVTLHREGDR